MKKNILFIFLFCILLSTVYGIPLNELPGLVEKQSKELESMRLDILTHRLDIKNQPFTYLPDLELSYRGSFSRPFFDDFSQTHTFSLTSSLALSDSRVFGDRIAVLEYEKLLMQYDQYYQQLLFEAIQLYIDALKKKVVYELAQTNESGSTLNYEYARSKNRQGTLSDIDLLNAEADYDNSLYVSRKAKLDFDMALSALRRKLNSPDLVTEDLVPGNPAYISIDDSSPETAAGRPPEPYNIMIQEKNLSILHLNKILAARNMWLPQFSIGLDLTYDQYAYSSITNEWAGMDPKINPAVTLSATIPLFANNEKKIAVEKSSIAMKKAELDLEELKSEFKETMTELVELHNRSVDLLNISNKRVQSAQKEYDMKSESFKLEITTLIELYDTRDRYMERRKEALFFSLDIVLLRARIGYAGGNTFLFLEDDKTEG